MTDAEKTLTRKWVDAWRGAGPQLERVRRAELRQIDSVAALNALSGPVDFFAEPFRARPTSGLVEQQRWFAKAQRD